MKQFYILLQSEKVCTVQLSVTKKWLLFTILH